MEAPWTYAYTGRLDRLAEVVTATKTYSFSPGRGGICGNIDSGGEAGKAHASQLVTPHATGSFLEGCMVASDYLISFRASNRR